MEGAVGKVACQVQDEIDRLPAGINGPARSPRGEGFLWMSAVGIPQGELLEYAIFVHYRPIVGISGMLTLENVNCKLSCWLRLSGFREVHADLQYPRQRMVVTRNLNHHIALDQFAAWHPF